MAWRMASKEIGIICDIASHQHQSSLFGPAWHIDAYLHLLYNISHSTSSRFSVDAQSFGCRPQVRGWTDLNRILLLLKFLTRNKNRIFHWDLQTKTSDKTERLSLEPKLYERRGY